MNITKSLLFISLISIGMSASSMSMNTKPIKNVSKKIELKNGDDEKHTHNMWHHKNEGKVIFYNKSIEYGSSSIDDNETGVITERVIAGEGPFSFRAYFEKSYKATCLDWSECDGMDIRYTIAGVSLTTSEVRASGAPTYYPRMAGILSFYDNVNYSVGVPLNSDYGKYYDMYTLQEDTYRILLSKVRKNLLMDSVVELKVEIIGMQHKLPTEVVLAVGTIPLKITSASNNLQSLNCRCGKSGMKDEKVINDAIEAFEWQFNDVKKVYKVVLLDRDFSELSNTPYFKSNIASKGMWANFIYETKEGTMMMVKRYLFYKKNGNTFSNKATIGNHKFYLPVSPTCVM